MIFRLSPLSTDQPSVGARRGVEGEGQCRPRFGLVRLLPHLLLDFRLSIFEFIQPLLEVCDFLLDLAEFCLVFAAPQATGAKLPLMYFSSWLRRNP